MTPSEIAALRALCDAATPGPWRERPESGKVAKRNDWHTIIDERGVPVVQTGFVEIHPGDGEESYAEAGVRMSPSDRAFIAAARTGLPDALSALEEARRDKDLSERILRSAGEEWMARALAAESRADALQAEVERLRAEVALVQSGSDLERARADAAWRAALEAAAKEVDGERCDECRMGLQFSALAAKIRALPPPSATPNEET